MSAPRHTARALDSLLPELGAAAGDVAVSDVTLDSRQVQPGALFLACAGKSSHGLHHADQAIASGARAVLVEPASGLRVPDFPTNIFVQLVPGLAARAGEIADRFFNQPSAQLVVAGITGTNGKTTCAWLLANALSHCGRPSAYIGTLGLGMVGVSEPGSSGGGVAAQVMTGATHTTPDVVSVHRALDELRRAGAQCVAMEVSSHALDQGRIDAVRMRAAAFTNLTRDHLDYHENMTAYGATKARLFERVDLAGWVINVDDEFGAMLAQRHSSGSRLILTTRTMANARRVRLRADEILRAIHVAASVGLNFAVRSGRQRIAVQLPLIGEFNVDNALTVLGMLRALDVPLEQAVAALERCAAPPGRMETFRMGASALVIVDYAHTPDALAKALHAARAHCSGTLRVIFGCGGDRDRGKRPQMAEAACASADELVLTDDNPRSESPQQIIADMIAGIPAGCSYTVVHDREQAIRSTLAASRAGDVLLIAGKGHEDYQIYGQKRRPFSDQAVVRAALGVQALGVQL